MLFPAIKTIRQKIHTIHSPISITAVWACTSDPPPVLLVCVIAIGTRIIAVLLLSLLLRLNLNLRLLLRLWLSGNRGRTVRYRLDDLPLGRLGSALDMYCGCCCGGLQRLYRSLRHSGDHLDVPQAGYILNGY